MTEFVRELNYFKRNQPQLVREYPGRVLIIKDERVVGDFSSPLEAYEEAKRLYNAGTYIIQPCVEGAEAYTVSVAGSYPSAVAS